MTTTFESRLGTYPTEGVKAPCAGSTSTNNTLTGLQGYDANDRVLVRGQTDTTENGVYTASSSVWRRASDFKDGQDVANGQLVLDAGAVPPVLYLVELTGDYVAGTSAVTFAAAITA